MRTLPTAGEGSSAGGFTSPAVIILLVLIFGATLYLWRQRYMRRKTAFIVMGVLAIAIAAIGVLDYTSAY